MFRRIMSPRGGDKSKQSDKGKGEKPRATSLSNVKNLNGHGGSSDLLNSLEVENSAYRDPELIHQPTRSQSMIDPRATSTGSIPTVTDSMENPPLPPRNTRPASIGHSPQQHIRKTGENDEPPVYVVPADTLTRKANATVISNYSQVEPSETLPTRKDIKKMSMHIETMKQKSGHRRVRSIGHVVDCSEYSTPFDLLKQNEAKGDGLLSPGAKAASEQSGHGAAPPKPPKNHHMHKHVKQKEIGGEVDIIIPVVSPTPPNILSDRSRTNSPSSPTSTQSSEQELLRDDGTNDYDEPWHDKFKNLNMPTFRHQVSEHHQASDSQHSHRQRHTFNHPSDEVTSDTHHGYRQRHSYNHPPEERTRGGSLLGDRVSPPSPTPWDHSPRGYRERDLASISPEVPNDRSLGFVKGSEIRSSGRRDGSVSPIPSHVHGRSYSHSQPPHHHHHPGAYPRLEDQSHLRTNSVGTMAGRQLPPTPPERNVDQRYGLKDSSPPPSYIDISIPLEDQP